jgi:hypothetical protein
LNRSTIKNGGRKGAIGVGSIAGISTGKKNTISDSMEDWKRIMNDP